MAKQFRLKSGFKPTGDQPAAIEALVRGINDGEAGMTLLGVTGSGKTFTVANVIQAVQRPTLVLAPNKTLAAQLYGEMREFFPDNAVEYFVSYYDYYQPEAYVPTTDTYIEKDASINDHIEQMRLSATKALLERRDAMIVATVSSIYGLGDPSAYLSMVLHLKRGDRTDQRVILRRLAELQYTRNDMELTRATYRVRGDVIDIHPAESEREAIRVELFDDEIESLSWFDPLTGEILRRVPRLTVYPKSHYVTPRQTILDTIEQIKVELRERLEELRSVNKLVEAQRLEQRTLLDLEMMQELGYCVGHRELLPLPVRAQAPASRRRPCSTTCRTTPCWSWTRATSPSPSWGPCTSGDRSRKETLVEYGFPAALGPGQPAPALRRVRAPGAPDHLRLGHARPLRARALRAGHRAGGAAHRAGGPGRSRCARRSPRWTTCSRRSACGPRPGSGCW